MQIKKFFKKIYWKFKGRCPECGGDIIQFVKWTAICKKCGKNWKF